MSMMLKFMATVVMMIAYNSSYFEGPEIVHIAVWIVYLLASAFNEIETKARHEKLIRALEVKKEKVYD